MSEVALAFYWHQHQPYYPDDVDGINTMPWVRLHGVKDYYGMALHLLEFPEMRCTINLVPSLLVQLQAYTERGGSDLALDIARVPADDLSEENRLYLLDQFFMADAEHMIKPYPRYLELYQRRAPGRNSAKEALRRFESRDFRDLQVWYNLTWVHPIAAERDPELQELHAKGRHFTEMEKNRLLDKHLEILREIIPLHRRLADSGQVELTTTPFFHPILPLLLDKKLARESVPHVKLPRYTGGYPEDAEVHVRRAIEVHTRIFGKAPRGMWPAEGSVCQTMIPLLAQHGIRWIATDEQILTHSTQGFISRDAHGHVRNPERMYRPFKVREGDHELGIVFRDHALSDMIGFHYQHSDSTAAAEDFVHHLHNIRQAVDSAEPVLVSVILDGENCWEHYPGGGVAFLRALYERCSRSDTIRPVTIGAYLERHPPHDVLPHLFAGSWINHNFAIWIGHEEDNTAWDALHRAREHLVKRSQESGARGQESGDRSQESGIRGQGTGVTVTPDSCSLTPDSCSLTPDSCPLTPVERAWDELYIAEGSDWFWWFGDDHTSAQDLLFDYLFRKHLQNVYLLLGDEPPPELGRPITRRGQRAMHSMPRSFLEVRIDGRHTFFEWIGAGRYVCQSERGTMAMVTTGPIKEVHFGFDRRTLFVRIDFHMPARQALADFDALRLGFVDPAGWELQIEAPTRPAPVVHLSREGRYKDHAGIAVAVERIVEVAIPFDLFGLKPDQSIQFFVDVLEGAQSRDRAPREGTIHLTCPAPDFEQQMWGV
jgi:alpha-amylase/alpha-mannosidase (GH57 family)